MKKFNTEVMFGPPDAFAGSLGQIEAVDFEAAWKETIKHVNPDANNTYVRVTVEETNAEKDMLEGLKNRALVAQFAPEFTREMDRARNERLGLNDTDS